MLLQFTVANFRSFHEPTTISFVKPDRPSEVYARPEDILRTVAIYGANASGKSNLVRALGAFRDLVSRGVPADAKLSRRPFVFAPDSGRTLFEVEARVASRQLGYRIELDETRVLTESLVEVHPSGQESTWLERNADTITTGGWLREREGTRLDFIVGRIRSNQPALFELRDRDVETARPLTNFIRDLVVEKPGDRDGQLAARYEASPALRDEAVRMLRPFDPHVIGVNTSREAKASGSWNFETTRADEFDSAGLSYDATRDEVVTMDLERAASGGVLLFDESDGSRRLLELVVPLADLRRRGGTLVVDEVERSLHPLMTRQLVRSWCEAPGDAGQMIFTTHDTHLLDVLASRPDFHPASIVFAEKGADLATGFHSLAEYKPEQIAELKSALETGYLAGRFGAVPVFTRGKTAPERAAE